MNFQSVAINLILPDGDFRIVNSVDIVCFHVGEKIVVEDGGMYVIKDIQHQVAESPFGYNYRCCNLVVEEQ